MKRNLKAGVLSLFILCTTSLSFSMGPQEIFKPITLGEVWDKKKLRLNKTLVFNKTSGAATSIKKTTISFFGGDTCSGDALGSNGAYTTPDASGTFTVNDNTNFGLTTTAAYEVASDKANISDMSSIGSMAVVLRSSESNVPQGNFTGSTCGTNPSFCCVKVDCTVGSVCTERDGSIGSQGFTLSDTAAIGDPADGGLIGCLVSAGDSDNLVVMSSLAPELPWLTDGLDVSTDSTDGATNTANIIAAIPAVDKATFAAGDCDLYVTEGGYTSNWFLPASSQLTCFYNNRLAAAIPPAVYWNSTQTNTTRASSINFHSGAAPPQNKTSSQRALCARALSVS